MTRTAGRALAVLAGGAIVLSAFAILPSPVDLLLFVVIATTYTAPGWVVARWVAGAGIDRLTLTILALPLGYFAGATTTCVLRLVGISSPFVVLAACAGLTVVLALTLRRSQGLVPLVRLGAGDGAALGLLSLLAIVIVGPVFARVGEVTPAGLAYRAYFNADLFVHMSVVGELAKGATPPLNPYYPVEPLPYYWTYFTLAGLFAQLRPALPVDPPIMLADMGTALIFLGAGYVTVRNLGASPLASTTAWLTVMLASSFEAAYFLWHQIERGRPFAEFRVWNIDAVTRWRWNLPGVDGFHRGMWWTPQHLMALTLAFVVLLVMVRARRKNSVSIGLLEGLLLGGIVALSSFNGVMLVAWYALAYVLLLLIDRGRELGAWLVARSVAAVIVVGFLGLTVLLGMVQMIPNAFLFGWNAYFLRGPWAFFLLSFGPALFLAPFGTANVVRTSGRLVIALLALVTVSLVAFLFVDLRGHENTQVTFRTAQILFICLVILLAFAIDTWRSWNRWVLGTGTALLCLGSAAAVPTVALDWYNARDISNVAMSPGNFPWTVHISPDDQAAVQWIQDHVPVDAKIQTDAKPRDRYTWAFIPAFARRRMGAGNGIFTLNPTRYKQGMDDVHDAFSTDTIEAAHAHFTGLDVDYLYVGDVERSVNGAHVEKFGQDPTRFERVYRRGSVEIFRVVRPSSGSSARPRESVRANMAPASAKAPAPR
jgi:hypothetical protein